MSDSRLVHMVPPSTKPSNNGGNGSNGGGSIENRLARLETRMEYVATKEDLKDMQITFIKWMIGIVIASSSLTIAILRVLS